MNKSHPYYLDWTKMVTVPITRVGERWEFFYGGDVPVEEGALGELTIGAAQITDKQFLARVTQKTEVKILEEGTSLMVALSDRSTRERKTPWPDVSRQDVPLGTTRFERIVIGPRKVDLPFIGPLQTSKPKVEPPKVEPLFIGPPQPSKKGGLWLRLKGLESSELVCTTIVMPDDFSEEVAVSLNHAYTLLSREYETHRISNTGNVYSQVFYQEANQRWYPLAYLRRGVRAQSEHTLINAAWKQVEETLGWRPIVVEGRRKKKRSGQ